MRQGLIESNRAGAIAGLSSINFDEIARQRVLDSIATTKLDSIKNLKSAYLEMKQRLGRVPKLIDFARFNAADPVVLATKFSNYGEFLRKFGEPAPPLGKHESAFLTYLSSELLNGKRPQELLLLDELIRVGSMSTATVSQLFAQQGCAYDHATVESALRVLSLEFHTAAERKKYGDQALIERASTGRLKLSSVLAATLQASDSFTEQVQDYLETGLYLARHTHSWEGTLQEGATYSRRNTGGFDREDVIDAVREAAKA